MSAVFRAWRHVFVFGHTHSRVGERPASTMRSFFFFFFFVKYCCKRTDGRTSCCCSCPTFRQLLAFACNDIYRSLLIPPRTVQFLQLYNKTPLHTVCVCVHIQYFSFLSLFNSKSCGALQCGRCRTISLDCHLEFWFESTSHGNSGCRLLGKTIILSSTQQQQQVNNLTTSRQGDSNFEFQLFNSPPLILKKNQKRWLPEII